MKKVEDERVERIIKSSKIWVDWPKPNVSFFDVFPLLADPSILELVTELFAEHLQSVNYDRIYMLESRGFLFAVPLSLKVKKPCHPFRKKGKLPGPVARLQYDLEYGTDCIEMQKYLFSNKGILSKKENV
jgi:adenine phosphoribosyltransferase